MTSDEYARDPDGWADARRIETRAQQGLPPVCDDPVAAARIADNVGPWLEQVNARGKIWLSP
jgi:hypothetical protein